MFFNRFTARTVAGDHDELDIVTIREYGKATAPMLLFELLDMYWSGVHREVQHVLTSLVDLHKVGEYSEEQKQGNQKGHSGLDTFIDQIWHAPMKATMFHNEETDWKPGDPQQPMHPLRKSPLQGNIKLQEAVHQNLQLSGKEDPRFIRARLLLQAAGFLDIDKLVEYKDPLENLPVWKKGKIPQLRLEKWRPDHTPQLGVQRCALCHDILRGVFFQCKQSGCSADAPLDPEDYACERCFRNHRHPQAHLVKIPKHCILDKIITPDISRRLCHCTNVSEYDTNGNYSPLYPIDRFAQHRYSERFTTCKLLQLPEMVAECRCRAVVAALENRKRLANSTLEDLKSLEKAQKSTNHSTQALTAKLSDTLDKDIPKPLRRFASRFPFGNTHVSLMVGPLIIENGVSRSKQGVVVSYRDPLNYYASPAIDMDFGISQCLVLSNEKHLFAQRRGPRQDRRIKACMKQVVGGCFSANPGQNLETQIIQALIDESSFASKSTRYELMRIQEGTARLVEKIRRLLKARISITFGKIVHRLLDPKVDLTWNILTNNCQNFCDAILSWDDFGDLFFEETVGGQPHYLLSFVVRNQSYTRAVVHSKVDVPNGLTEEYLLSFRSGRHDDSDIFDTLQEYWHDFGAFHNHLYKYQDVFPWDCTEAYSRSKRRCNDCSLFEHVWAFPFDSWSMIQLHLQKGRHWYTPEMETSHTRLTDKGWMENRMKVMLAQDALLQGAVAMSKTSGLRQSCKWFRTCEPIEDRLKLGGIHRAQPYSHHFEQDRFTQLFVAPWTHLKHQDRVKMYEALRETRKQAADVGKPPDKKDVATNLHSNSFFKSYQLPGLVTAAVTLANAHSSAVAISGVGGVDSSVDMASTAIDSTDAAVDAFLELATSMTNVFDVVLGGVEHFASSG